MNRLPVEGRRDALALRRLTAEREHVGRDVAAVDVEARSEERDQQPPGPAGDVERGLSASLDDAPEVVDLRPADVELRPPPGDDAVVPGLRRYAVSSATSQRAISAYSTTSVSASVVSAQSG